MPAFHGWWRRLGRVRAAYRLRHRRPPNLWRPRRYSEKIQWRKLFDLDPAYPVLCDKLAARAFIVERLPEAPLPPLLWQGDDPERIPFDTLQPPYVLKSSHGCGQLAFVDDAPPDRPALVAAARQWLGHCHGTAADEPGYVPVPRRLLAEQRLFGPDGAAPLERRFFVFGGRVGVINTVFVEGGEIRNGAFHRPDWQRLPWHFTRDLGAMAFPPPPRLRAMLEAASRIGAGFEHVRVDVYDAGERFWIGEVTVYPWSGHAVFHPDQADFELGRLWRLRRPRWRAVAAMLDGDGRIRPAAPRH